MLRAVFTRSQVQGLNESRLTIRGDEDQGLSPLRRFWQVLSYSPRRLVSQSATLHERSAQNFDGPSTWPQWSLGHTFDVEGVSIFSSQTKRISLRLWPFLVCRLGHRRRPVGRFLKQYILETVFHQLWTKAQSMTWRTSQMFIEAFDICNHVSRGLNWFEDFWNGNPKR